MAAEFRSRHLPEVRKRNQKWGRLCRQALRRTCRIEQPRRPKAVESIRGELRRASWDKYRLWRATDEINWNISESVTLRSLTGYQYTENKNQWDNDFTYLPISVANQQFRESTFEQEFNLISNGAGAFNWILGAFYLRDSTPTLLTLTVPPTIQIITGPHERSYALFGQATYKITDQWQLLVGGRANRDEKTSTGTEQLVGFPFPPPVVARRDGQDHEADGKDRSKLPSQSRLNRLCFGIERIQAGRREPEQQRQFHFPARRDQCLRGRLQGELRSAGS